MNEGGKGRFGSSGAPFASRRDRRRPVNERGAGERSAMNEWGGGDASTGRRVCLRGPGSVNDLL